MQITSQNTLSLNHCSYTWSLLEYSHEKLKKAVILRYCQLLKKYLRFQRKAKLRAMSHQSLIATIAFLTLIVFFRPPGIIAKRCDRQVNVYAWNRCMECSINRFLGCPTGYRRVTGGEGVQRCTYFVHFGANYGRVAVPGCQHLCARTITQKECCDGFWGQDCQGI